MKKELVHFCCDLCFDEVSLALGSPFPDEWLQIEVSTALVSHLEVPEWETEVVHLCEAHAESFRLWRAQSTHYCEKCRSTELVGVYLSDGYPTSLCENCATEFDIPKYEKEIHGVHDASNDDQARS